MSTKKVLFYTLTIGLMCVLATWLIGHLWVFIILVTTALIGIAWTISTDTKQGGDHKTEDDEI